MDTLGFLGKQRLSKRKKNANKKAWYKDQIDRLDFRADQSYLAYNSGLSEYKRKKINYDMLNNIVNLRDYDFITSMGGNTNSLGSELHLPATMQNWDIVNPKIKVIQGMEINRPFDFLFVAVNEDATTRKEQEEFKMVKDYLVEELMRPIKEQMVNQQIEQAAQQGKELSEEEVGKLRQQVEQESQRMTPEEVKKYMKREYQDPAEVMVNQLAKYLIKEHNVERIIHKAWKHGLTTAYEIYYVGILNQQIKTFAVNALHFYCDKGPMFDDIADSEWAKYDMFMTPSQIVNFFGEELTDKQIDDIYKNSVMIDNLNMTWDDNANSYSNMKIRVAHATWKSLTKIGTLFYIDDNGEIQQEFVSEDYKLNTDYDLKIEWEWIPNVEEGYKICIPEPIYVYCRPVEGQNTDLDRINEAKLPYTGVIYDNLNASPTSIVDRLKPYQYLLNIIMYRIELLMASDKGKLLLLNMNLIPKSQNIDIKQWHYYAEMMKIGYLNPAEEGNKNGAGGDIVNAAKVVDMSLASDINQYIQLAEYIQRKAGESVGIPKEMEGQSSPYQSVRNTQSAMTQSRHILEPYFELHNFAKKKYIDRLVQTAKVYYQIYDKKVLTYVLDDMSQELIKIDLGLLANNSFGLFVTDSVKDAQIVNEIKQLVFPAMQAGNADLSDVIKVLRADSSQQAEEFLKTVEERKAVEKHEQQKELEQMRQQAEKDKDEREMKKMEYERETKLLIQNAKDEAAFERQLILSTGFNEDKDFDKDGVPDLLEIAQEGRDADIKLRQQKLEERKFDHQKEVDKEKLKIEKENKKSDKKSK